MTMTEPTEKQVEAVAKWLKAIAYPLDQYTTTTSKDEEYRMMARALLKAGAWWVPQGYGSLGDPDVVIHSDDIEKMLANRKAVGLE